MARSVLLVLALAGCETQAPAADVQPDLDFTSPYDITAYHQPVRHAVTAIGGTQVITLLGPTGKFNQPYTAVVAGDGIRVDRQDGPDITIRGVTNGGGTLVVQSEDGEPIDSDVFASAELTTVTLDDSPGGTSIAFLPGARSLAVGLLGASGAVVDTSTQIAFAGADQSSGLHVPSLPAGIYAVSVTAGGRPWSLDFVVVDQADTISTAGQMASDPIPTAIVPGERATLCFDAFAGQRSIVDVPWTLSAAGPVSEVSAGGRCVAVRTDQTSGAITINAMGAGQSMSVTLPIVPP